MRPSERLSYLVSRDSLLWGDPVRERYDEVAAREMNGQWTRIIAPLLAEIPIDLARVIDFAAGFGRNTRKLIEAGAGHVTMVDVNPDCIRVLAQSFPQKKATAVLNDGHDLMELSDRDYSFLYSFDSMVHFDLELIIAYMPEFFRVLRPEAYAFLHHSNLGTTPGADFRMNPHMRNYMTADLFRHVAIRAGFLVQKQSMLSWGGNESGLSDDTAEARVIGKSRRRGDRDEPPPGPKCVKRERSAPTG